MSDTVTTTTPDEFAATALNARRVVFAIARRANLDPDDVVADFVCDAMEKQLWRKFDAARGNLEAFVVQYLVQYARHEVYLVGRSRRCEAKARAQIVSSGRNVTHKATPFAALVASQTLDAIRFSLTPEQYTMLHTYVVSGCKPAVVADMLGTTPENVYNGMQAVRRRLTRRGFDRHLCRKA